MGGLCDLTLLPPRPIPNLDLTSYTGLSLHNHKFLAPYHFFEWIYDRDRATMANHALHASCKSRFYACAYVKSILGHQPLREILIFGLHMTISKNQENLQGNDCVRPGTHATSTNSPKKFLRSPKNTCKI